MRRNPFIAFLLLLVLTLATNPAAVRGAVSPELGRKIFNSTTPSLVAVQFVWVTEIGRRELVGAGVVVDPSGLVMMSIATTDMLSPDALMKDFKIIVPRFDKDP